MWLLLALLLQDDSRPIVEKLWTSVRTSLEKLGVSDLDAARTRYFASASTLEKELAKLPPETREAIAASANLFAALEEHKLRVPSIRDFVPKTAPPRLKDGEGAATMKKLVGTWKSEWKAAGITTTWTIAEDGTADEEVVRKTETKTTKLKLDFAHERRIGVTRGTTRQDYTFLLLGDVFYASSNLLYDIHRVPDRARFTIPSEWDWLIVADGTYTMIGDSGVSATAEAKVTDKELHLKWRYPARKYDMTRTYRFEGEYLIHSGAQAFRK